ncbi:inverse autotransporter beta domain-containing protein [Gimesia aquarii]|uniref:Inverse autotransporter beta-domain domain-containing protein n=1 Tax=Gimesia aquarii TaxID=2527964 RepID=A0A517W0R3_9PLAN|nr:inverse autotransporter beta domain-containing protein [Gimesia aquarii]QDT98844.1 hypothetical protein V144x_43530 [Gimesia aquarii]
MRRNSQQSRSQILIRSGLLILLALHGTSTAFAQDFTPRFGHHTQTPENGIDENFSDFRAFVPFGDEDLLLFFDTRLLVDHNSEFGFNLGTGLRGQLGFDGFWGINVFTDQRRTAFSTYRQVGFGWELMFERLQFRNNFYVPVGRDRTILSTGLGGSGTGTLLFENNSLLFDTLIGQKSQIEQSLRGFDCEVGGELAEDLIDGTTISGYLGAYYYDNPGLTDAPGISGRLNTNFSNSVVLNLGIQHDRFFKTQVTFGATLYTDILKRDRPVFRRPSYALMNDPVYRKSAITVAQGIIGPPPVQGHVTLTNPDGSALRVVHVNSTAPHGGDGTYENPLNNLGDILANSQTGDNVYLYSGSTFSGEGTLQLQDGQRLFGEGGNFASRVNTLQLGSVALPAGNGLGGMIPIIQNSTNNAIELANSTLASNLSIIDPATGAGIFGNNVASSVIDNVMINTTVDNVAGIHLQGTSVVTLDHDSKITTNGKDAYGILVQNTSQATVDNSSTITTHGDTAYGIFTQDTSAVMVDHGSSITTNGPNAYGIHAVDSSQATVDNGGSITTHGHSAYGIYTLNSSKATLTNNSNITTNGLNADGILAQNASQATVDNNSSITTHGDNAFGIFSQGTSVVKVDNGSNVTTNGLNAFGIYTLNSSKATLTNNSKVITNANDAHGIYSVHSSQALVDYGSSVTTHGNFAYGINTKDTAATLVSVDHGSSITTNGLSAYGVYTEDFSKVTVTNSSNITTNGKDAHGIVSIDSSQATLDYNSNVTTHGETAYGIFSQKMSNVYVYNGSHVTTHGLGALGLYVFESSELTFSTSNITTHGEGAYGIFAPDDALVKMDHSSITTHGKDAFGVYALGTSDVSVYNGSNITTHGESAVGINTHLDTVLFITPKIKIYDMVNITTNGTSAYGIFGTRNSDIDFTNSSITTNGANGHGIYHFHDTDVTIKDGSTITANGHLANSTWSLGDSNINVTDSSLFSNTGIGMRATDCATLTVSKSSIFALNNDSILAEANHGAQEVGVNITDNRLGGGTAGTGTIVLHTHGGTTIKVTGASNAADLADQNGIPPSHVFTTGSGTVNYFP